MRKEKGTLHGMPFVARNGQLPLFRDAFAGELRPILLSRTARLFRLEIGQSTILRSALCDAIDMDLRIGVVATGQVTPEVRNDTFHMT